jgi:hypothetical protein
MLLWGQRLWWVYLSLTLGFFLLIALVWLVAGVSGLEAIAPVPHGSSRIINWATCAISWLLIGLPLAATRVPSFARRHGLFLAIFVLLAFSYLGQIREPHRVGDDPAHYGDFRAYFLAATEMSRDQPITQGRWRRYLYPPLLATLLGPLVPWGFSHAAQIFHLLNYAAVLLLCILLYLALPRYGFSRELAALAVLGAMVVNVPVSQTLIYRQVNLHVANLILLSLLWAGRFDVWSALALTVAIHLKIYPVVLVLPFVSTKAWRWCGTFALANLAIIAMTSMLNSPRYYMGFLTAIGELRETSLQNASVDVWVYQTLRQLHVSTHHLTGWLALAIRFMWAIILFMLWRRSKSCDELLQGYAGLPLLMLVVSPSLWSHHFVLLLLPVLVIGSRLREGWESWAFGVAYAWIVLSPTYQVYPLSSLRLLGLGLLTILMWVQVTRLADAEPVWFGRLKARLTAWMGSDPLRSSSERTPL